MNIKGRLLMQSIFFSVSLLLVSGLFYYQIRNAKKYDTLVLSMMELKVHSYETNLSLDRLFYGSDLIDEHERFVENYSAMREEMDDFFVLPLYMELSGHERLIENDTTTLVNMLLMTDDDIEQLGILIREAGSRYTTYLPGLFEAADFYNDDLIHSARDEVETLSLNFSSQVSEQLDLITDHIMEMTEQFEKKTERTVTGLIFIVILSSLFLSMRMMGYLRKRIEYLKEGIEILKQGDFSKPISEKGKDEISEISSSINEFLHLFTHMIRQIRTLAERTNVQKDEVEEAASFSVRTATELSARVEQLKSEYGEMVRNLGENEKSTGNIARSLDVYRGNVENQTSSINQSTASVEEMSASVKNLSEIIRQRKEASEKMVDITAQGRARLEQNNELIKENALDAEEVTKIISIINGISARTNLLAMNAAIEAAHAGDSGRGFSVVAEEIRKLAESTSENSKKIRETVVRIGDRIKEIHSGSEGVQSYFHEIFSETRELDDALTEIHNSIRELNLGSGEISQSMTDLNNSTVEILRNNEAISRDIAGADTSIKNLYQIGNKIFERMESLNQGMGEIRSVVEKVKNLNSANGEMIVDLNGELGKFLLEEGVSRE